MCEHSPYLMDCQKVVCQANDLFIGLSDGVGYRKEANEFRCR